MEKESYKNLLVGITGSVAAVRFEQIIQQFYSLHKFNIKAIITDKAKIFLEKLISDYKEIEKKYECEIYFDNDEFELYKKDENRVLHIELRKWADLVLLAPLSANTLAKITNGICDNLLTSVIRAWDFKKKVFFVLQ
jgi:phosphopantothenoylcysteine decarboxylase